MKAIDYEEENTKRMTALELTGGPAHGGLTVLDWFAGKAIDAALKRMMHNFDVDLPNENWTVDDHDLETVAILAYRLAGYMMAERKKRNAAAPVVTGVTGKHYG